MDSILINTYNRPEMLSRCLENLSRQSGIGECEVIVVDDGSRGSFHAIERLWSRKLNFKFTSIRHAGRSAARNRAAKMASGERIIFLGDDIFVRPGWLARHLEQGRGERMKAVVGPAPLENNPDYSTSFLKWAEALPLEKMKGMREIEFTLFATGNLSMDREVFHEIGGFDERFKEYGWEDIDLGYRFARAGGVILYDEQAKAIHNHPHMTRRDLWRREFEHGITAFQFWDKWRNDDVKYMKFWDDTALPAGSALRRSVGAALIEATEKLLPNSRWLPPLYARMVYACRHAGVAEAMRRAELSESPTHIQRVTTDSAHP